MSDTRVLEQRWDVTSSGSEERISEAGRLLDYWSKVGVDRRPGSFVSHGESDWEGWMVEFHIHPNFGVGSGKSLRDYRKFAVAQFLIGAYQMSGFVVEPKDKFKPLPRNVENEDFIRIRWLSLENHTDKFLPDLQIGPVIFNGGKESDPRGEAIYQIYKSRAEGCKRINESSHGSGFFPMHSIVSTVVNWECLSRPPTDPINIDGEKTDEIEYGPRALYYNYNRLASVILTFEKRVEDNVYPSLPPCQEVWEWDILADGDSCHFHKDNKILYFLKHWPHVLQKTIATSDPSQLTQFIIKFNEACDHYYFSSHVLVPSDARHRFKNMYRQIYMYKAITNFILDLISLFFSRK